MYPDVFQGLDKFVHFILPNIPAYLGKTDFPNADTQVFQRFDGFPVTSSEVTPLLRYSLKKFGLKFEGTVTYFRRAAATLTGQISHHLAEKMALYLGHSRRVHDKHYRILMGDFGLSEMFSQLELMQTNPFPTVISNKDNSNQISQQLNIIDSPDNSIPISQPSNIEIVFSNDCVSYSSGKVIENTSSMQFSSEYFDSGKVDSLCSNDASQINKDTLSETLVNLSLWDSVDEVSYNPIYSTPNRSCTRSFRNNLVKKDKVCRLIISPIQLDATSHHKSQLNKSLFSQLFAKSHHRSIFFLRTDEYIFISVFDDLILRVSHRALVKRKVILERAFSNAKLAPLIRNLREHFLNCDISKMLVNKVRTLGYKARMIAGSVSSS